jgi:signal transduction histidine kinase
MTRSSSESRWLGSGGRWATAHGWAADGLLALACAVVLGGLSLSSAQDLRWTTGWAVTLVVTFAVLHLTVAIRGRAAELAYALASAAMLVVVLAPYGRVVEPTADGPTALPALLLPSSLVFLVSLYGVAVRAGAVRARVALGLALAGVVVATATTVPLLRVVGGGWPAVLYVGLALAVTAFLAWSLGRFARVRDERAEAERAESARRAVLEERTRVAREMHDIVAHSLAVIVRQAEGGAFVADRDPQRAAQALGTIADSGRTALADMRSLVGVLRDPAAASSLPAPTMAELPDLVAGVRDTGVDVALVETGAPFPVGAVTELATYRLVQEGLTNAVKHAGPRVRVRVDVTWQEDALRVEVTDDGGDAGGPAPVPGAGAGLAGLRERVAAVGGAVTAERRDRGFHLGACFPRTTGGAR